jgi:uncharacterized protein (TIGR02145 family)
LCTNSKKTISSSGWHVPSDEEWTTLTAFFGGNADITGGKMKKQEQRIGMV